MLRVSYMEIYNETVTDLLVDSWKRKPLEVRETINVSGFEYFARANYETLNLLSTLQNRVTKYFTEG